MALTAPLSGRSSARDEPTWRQLLVVRCAAGTVTALVLLGLTYYSPSAHGELRWGTFSLELDTSHASVYAALLLMPFMRSVAYRKRDVLLVVLVPIYGQLVAGVMVSRLLALPRRDWLPRVDELDRVVRIPGGRGAYLLPATFGEAEHLRTLWCRNPDHHHPYDRWSVHQLWCTRKPDGRSTRRRSGR